MTRLLCGWNASTSLFKEETPQKVGWMNLGRRVGFMVLERTRHMIYRLFSNNLAHAGCVFEKIGLNA